MKRQPPPVAVSARARKGPGRGLPSRLVATGLVVAGFGGLATTNALAAFVDRQPRSTAVTRPTLVQPDPIVRSGIWSGAPGSSSISDTQIRLSEGPEALLTLWGGVRGATLARSLFVTVVRGSGRGEGFTPDADGLIFRGTLARLPGSSEEGIEDPHIWSPGDTETYRITVTLGNDASQGSLTSATFSWSASPA